MHGSKGNDQAVAGKQRRTPKTPSKVLGISKNSKDRFPRPVIFCYGVGETKSSTPAWEAFSRRQRVNRERPNPNKSYSVFDISSLNHSQIQLTCLRLTYLNEDATDFVQTICGIVIKAAAMNVSIEIVVCSQ